MATPEAEMEEYAKLLDELYAKDPQAYEQFVQMMKQQVEAAGAATEAPSPQLNSAASTPSMLDMIKNAATEGASAPKKEEFKPQFPGNKVMASDGLSAKQEGMYIDVEPGFVMKTTDIHKKRKVFVNFCFSDVIQTFSQRKQLDEEGKEQEGIHVPLSLGAPREVKDKRGDTALAFDVAVNTQVIEDSKTDKTGSFRNFVCELAIEYIDQKYQVKLDSRYKLPKLTYRGELPPPKHYIRKTQKPIIQEVDGSKKATKSATTKAVAVETPAKTATLQHELFDVVGDTRKPCTRVPAVDLNGSALSEEVLRSAGTHLLVLFRFETAVASADDVELELRPEYLTVKVTGHQDLSLFLPYPVQVATTTVVLDRTKNTMEIRLAIDKSWGLNEPDVGSAPWLLTQALRDEDSDKKDTVDTKRKEEEPKSLVDMFHLAMPKTEGSDASSTTPSTQEHTARWDPVDEDDELPEDRFHRRDMMSMHILEQRKKERQLKAQEAEEKRKTKRAEVEAKQKAAQEAGKTWREMYPNEPETTYIDMEDIIAREKEKKKKQTDDEQTSPNESNAKTCVPSDSAVQVAAAWSEEKKTQGLDLNAALAFDLLD
ncbi:hypothetical protein Poli38472_000148 [Pythium oligandrum]|uniref:PIH1 N-terminal domain-containing protein n=1 Tax=Pythium oligandrum TaxID=41045 RepID=A0A8K1FF32_PYTOL|nr:hypothetical protein Poli38472_000148 [Pythium oligandrum]|eukprot:TMW60106.1 hypothetical protein Poli38472_000148 [Pythium oligandrum]